MTEILAAAALTLVAGVAAMAISAWSLHLVRRRSFRYPLTIATVLPVIAAVLVVVVDVFLGFLSAPDFVVVLFALATSLAVAVLIACRLTKSVTSASAQVGETIRQLVEDTTPALPGVVAPSRPAHSAALPQELSSVVADLARARTALAEARTRERAAEQSRHELVSFMSHDLRTPLAGLRALSEGLEDGVIVDLPRALSHLSSTVNRMSGLVDDLFALSRVQTAPARPEKLVSLTEVITDVASELTTTAAASRVDIDIDVPADDRLAVLGAPDDLTRALTNLVANAIRHTDPDLTVRLLGRRAEDGQVQVAVIDGCGGIPEENLPHLFDTGWRGSPSRFGDHGGAGLGLAIARGVVQSHAGQIAVRNVQGGCLFQVDLPPSAQVEA